MATGTGSFYYNSTSATASKYEGTTSDWVFSSTASTDSWVYTQLPNPQYWISREGVTDEYLLARQRAEEQEQTLLEQEQARTRAENLLLSALTKEQQRSYKERDFFDVISQFGETYRIYKGNARNVALLKEGKEQKRLCAYVTGNVPVPDINLMQKLMLEACEQEFLRIANVSDAH